MTGTTIDERNGALFYQIADILEFMPQAYDQETWGTFNEDALVEADFAAFAERWVGGQGVQYAEVCCWACRCVVWLASCGGLQR